MSPAAKKYELLKRTWNEDYEDNHWAEDSIFLERNSRDFVSRIDRIGTNAEAICDVLSTHPRGTSSVIAHIQSNTNAVSSETSELPKNQSNTSKLRKMPESKGWLRRSARVGLVEGELGWNSIDVGGAFAYR